MNSNWVIVPFMLTVLDLSYVAAEYCANTLLETMMRATITGKTANSLLFIVKPPNAIVQTDSAFAAATLETPLPSGAALRPKPAEDNKSQTIRKSTALLGIVVQSS